MKTHLHKLKTLNHKAIILIAKLYSKQSDQAQILLHYSQSPRESQISVICGVADMTPFVQNADFLHNALKQ